MTVYPLQVNGARTPVQENRTTIAGSSRQSSTKARRIGLPILLGGMAMLATLSASAQCNVSLAWNPSSGQAIKGYNLYWGGASQTYTNELNAGSATLVTLSNLTVGATYYCAVTAYDTNGVESLFSNEIHYTATNPPVATVVSFASTSGTITAPFVVANGTISQPAQTGVTTGGQAVYTFTAASAGNYTIAAVVNAPNEGANSFYVNIDAQPTDPAMTWDIPVTTGFTNRLVSWRGSGTTVSNQFTPKIFALSQGTHQLIIRGREANTVLGAITISPVLVLPAPWQTVDIGAVGTPGSGNVSGAYYLVNGAGSVSGVGDSFRFVYQPLTGDGQITTQINSSQGANVNGCTGAMIRESLTAGSRYTLMGLAPDGTFHFQSRASTGGSTATTKSGSGTAPNAYVRLARTGNTLVGYWSADGAAWTTFASATNVMATNIYLGFAVSSGATNILNNSTFVNVNAVP